MINFTIPGPPVGKQRPRFVRHGRHVQAYTPAQTVNYEALVKQTFAAKYPDFVPLPGPVRMMLSIYIMPSKETARKIKKSVASIRPTIKPDASNVLKAVEDALNGLAYQDDKQVVDVSISKHYSTRPMVAVVVKELP
ncbi:MAG: RusA family crossover junction endodeoxyribonuclease [Chloroflexi bacterium]|nr:RusA family crossover junction endodeoxyribonuclease [Chloroflexota bacterium]